MEPENQPKIIFGLTPKSTIINAVILAFLSQLFWVLKYVQQIPDGLDFKNPPEGFELIDNVPWYYDMPITVLAMIMGIAWINFKFKIEPSDFSWRAIKFKYIYLILGVWIIQAIAKSFFLFILI